MGVVAPPQAPPRPGRRSREVMRVRAPANALPGPQRTPLPASVLVAVWALASLSALAVWFLLYAFLLSGLQEASSQRALYAALRTELAQGTAPLGGNIALGQPVAVLRVPQAGISDVVVEGTSSGILEEGPGLVADAPLPGQPGLSVIYGRQTMFGGVFGHLSALQRGDALQVTTGQGTFTYRVQALVYPGDPLPSLLPAGQGQVILVTTTGSGWLGAVAPDRFLQVYAALAGKPVAAPGGRPATVPASQEAMHGDISVLVPLVFWLQLLLVTVLAVAWARSRWGGWQTWLVGAPAILAAVWAVSQVAVALLPNLL